MANVVIVTDMLRGFHDMGHLQNPRTGKIIPNIVKLLDEKVRDGWTVVFLRDYHDPDDKEFEMFPIHCVAGSPETRIVLELARFTALPKSVVVNKTRYSGFFGTYLDRFLREENPDELIVVGVCTDICVLFTVADLRMRDYKVTVPEDCVETFDALGHQAEKVNKCVLNYMRNILGVKIVNSKKPIC